MIKFGKTDRIEAAKGSVIDGVSIELARQKITEKPQAVAVQVDTIDYATMGKVGAQTPALAALREFDPQGFVNLSDKALTAFDTKAAKLVSTSIEGVLAKGVRSTAFERGAENVRGLGRTEILNASTTSNALLDRPQARLKSGAVPVANNISALRSLVQQFDPNSQPELSRVGTWFRMLPFFNDINAKVGEFIATRPQIDAIVSSLFSGRDALVRDNIAIEIEKKAAEGHMDKLGGSLYLAHQIDNELVTQIEKLEAQDPQKATLVEQELLLPLRRRIVDVQTQLAVSIQAYLALNLIKSNNFTLMESVDRVTTTTMHALKTALGTSNALDTQQQVLTQVNAVNRTTENLLTQNSTRLKTQSAQIGAQAGQAMLNPEVIGNALTSVVEALDAADAAEKNAVRSLQTTIESLNEVIEKAKPRLTRALAEENKLSQSTEIAV